VHPKTVDEEEPATQAAAKHSTPDAVEKSLSVDKLFVFLIIMSTFAVPAEQLMTRTDGRRVLTPLFVVLVTIRISDLLFARDSIPAVFGVTEHSYIVFVANAFAVLGVRPLFLLVSGLLDRVVYLSSGPVADPGLHCVKLIFHLIHLDDLAVPQISTGVIVMVLACTTVARLVKTRADSSLRAHAGRLHAGRLREPGRIDAIPGRLRQPQRTYGRGRWRSSSLEPDSRGGVGARARCMSTPMAAEWVPRHARLTPAYQEQK
jgi:predicted tellurium resistance membrane protein TerC